MTRVDFYVLSATESAQTTDDSARLDMVCKLAEKAFRQSRKVFIHTDNAELANKVDAALWDFRSDSFVPHCTISRDEQSTDNTITHAVREPVAIGYGTEPDLERSVLINLAETVPPFFSRFERTLEVVSEAPGVREGARERYRYYQHRGYPLNHHKL